MKQNEFECVVALINGDESRFLEIMNYYSYNGVCFTTKRPTNETNEFTLGADEIHKLKHALNDANISANVFINNDTLTVIRPHIDTPNKWGNMTDFKCGFETRTIYLNKEEYREYSQLLDDKNPYDILSLLIGSGVK